jgi:hypothetical protein
MTDRPFQSLGKGCLISPIVTKVNSIRLAFNVITESKFSKLTVFIQLLGDVILLR